MSGLFVTFGRGHVQETNKNDIHENSAAAYISITGLPYPADQGDKGTEVCRVWLLDKDKDKFLVTWDDMSYKRSAAVNEHINTAKDELVRYRLDRWGTPDKMYEFIYDTKATVTARNITEALEKMDRGDKDSVSFMIGADHYNGVICTDSSGIETCVQRTYSKKTGKTIWFEPGCPCGREDCIFDPMIDIAMSCDSQTDLTSDRQVTCDSFQDNGCGGCDHYDDEDK